MGGMHLLGALTMTLNASHAVDFHDEQYPPLPEHGWGALSTRVARAIRAAVEMAPKLPFPETCECSCGDGCLQITEIGLTRDFYLSLNDESGETVVQAHDHWPSSVSEDGDDQVVVCTACGQLYEHPDDFDYVM